MDDRSDGHLLAAWGRGETLAFDTLVRRHQGPLLRHAAALLGEGGSPEDAVQETFLRLAEKPPTLSASAQGDPAAERAVLACWLHRVTRNLCLDAMRSERRRRKREEWVAAREESADGLTSVEEEETRQAVERSLSRLPADQREVLVLRLLGERTYKEIAEITGKKVGTIGWLISVGLKTLGRELAPLIGAADVAHSPDAPGTTRAARLQGELS